jgi:hypothetical protein
VRGEGGGVGKIRADFLAFCTVHSVMLVFTYGTHGPSCWGGGAGGACPPPFTLYLSTRSASPPLSFPQQD